MTTKTVTLELPEELLASLNSEEDIAARAKKALVLDLLRAGEISQGWAAHLLGVTLYDVLDLMALHHIESGPRTAEEARQEVESAWRSLRSAPTDVGG